MCLRAYITPWNRDIATTFCCFPFSLNLEHLRLEITLLDPIAISLDSRSQRLSSLATTRIDLETNTESTTRNESIAVRQAPSRAAQPHLRVHLAVRHAYRGRVVREYQNLSLHRERSEHIPARTRRHLQTHPCRVHPTILCG